MLRVYTQFSEQPAFPIVRGAQQQGLALPNDEVLWNIPLQVRGFAPEAGITRRCVPISRITHMDSEGILFAILSISKGNGDANARGHEHLTDQSSDFESGALVLDLTRAAQPCPLLAPRNELSLIGGENHERENENFDWV
jgi:hypothetical protein